MAKALVQKETKHCTADWLLAPWVSLPFTNRVSGMTLDSRTIQQGELFVALQGAINDGRHYIPNAIKAGASIVLSETTNVTEHGQFYVESNVPIIHIFELPKQLSEIAIRYYFPLKNIHQITAVTGTNGKTTIASLLANSYDLLGKKSAQMGTIGNGLYGQLQASLNTTLDAISVCRELNNYQAQGVQNTIMEVSSHGLSQGRVAAIPFTTAIFTNLTRDHLDYHGSMEAYAEAKEQLFKAFPLKNKIINADDVTGKRWLLKYPDAIAYGFNLDGLLPEQRYFKIMEVQYLAQGIAFEFSSSWGDGSITAPFYGAFNIANIAAVCCALLVDGYTIERLQLVIAQLTVVPGRMEQYFFPKQQVTFVVDYAHTPDALVNALQALQSHKQKGRIIAVFGCGGDRDKGKRPEMAKAAEQGADQIVIVDDNPRSENAQQIIEDIKKGLTVPEQALVIHDRQQAISHLLKTAQVNDIILIAGKGHEDYQIFGDKKVHYSDRECLNSLLESCNNQK
jgi:UDP-N-acetylmuramoyl-L-alanyl-D-glutamate--2,6-diaminopimelate ligase